jgi:hypothetical protein
MTYEEMQKTMQFILEQQAQFAADIQKAQESQAETNQIVNRLAAATLDRFERSDARVSALSEDVDAKFAALIDAQMRTDENVKKTDEAVRNLTAVVDRYFRERNGQKDSE